MFRTAFSGFQVAHPAKRDLRSLIPRLCFFISAMLAECFNRFFALGASSKVDYYLGTSYLYHLQKNRKSQLKSALRLHILVTTASLQATDFMNLTKTQNSDYSRKVWRNGRLMILTISEDHFQKGQYYL